MSDKNEEINEEITNENDSKIDETGPTDFGGAKPVTIEELGFSELPTPNEAAIEAELEREKRLEGVDKNGEPFDSDIHATDKNGHPKKTKAGTWAKRRGRKAGAAIKTDTDKSREEIAKQEAAFKSCAIVATQSQEMLMTTIYGGAGTFDNAGEKNQAEQVWYNYFKSKGIDDIPPGLAVAICVISHGVKSHTKEEAKPRITKIKKRFGNWWFDFKERRKEKKASKRRERGEAPVENLKEMKDNGEG